MGGYQIRNNKPKKNTLIVNRPPGSKFRLIMVKSLLSRERGQELIEFAVVLPLLLLVMFGVLDLGRAFHANITIANASRAGARYATSYGFESSGGSVTINVAETSSRTQQEAQNSGITLDSVSVDCVGVCVRGGSLEVTVTYNFQLLINAFIGSGINMSQTTEMLIPW